VVRTARGTEGVLILHRDSDTAFSDEEAGELAAVLPYIRQLWTKPSGPASEVFNDTEGHGTLVCDSDGHIRHGSRNAAQLLAMAQRQGAMSCSGGNKQLPPELMGLQQRLLTLDTPGAHAGPPVLYVNNRWGRFVFRASWLEGVGHGATPLVAIGITRQEPLAVSVVRGLQSSPLSPKQRDVALMLVTGRSAEDIVKELSISVTTYKDHLRKIYEKLGISKRVDLIHHLTQPTPAP
jgi:DNA-binding CsgD family transcriptional regulator